jgi:hypothetical protein
MRLLVQVATLAAFAFAAPASSTTRTQAAARCKQVGSTKPTSIANASVAGAACMKNGNFAGPVTHVPWKNLQRQ